MRFFATLVVISAVVWTLSAQQKAAAPKQSKTQAKPQGTPALKLPPETMQFANTYGDVSFTHKKHFDRVGGDCGTCHTSIFQQTREDINYKKALHRAAEASKKSCAFCHRVGGTSFAADSNCTKCHASKYKKSAVPADRVILAFLSR
jgi:c(7)-type cytochrome triheme protein